MLSETINYADDGRVNLQTFVRKPCRGQEQPFPALIVCPGGAWTQLSPREADPVALTFSANNFQTFVLNYSIGEYSCYPDVLIEAAWAVKTIREHADEWHVDPNAIFISGFSAGASLAQMLATQWKDPAITEALGGKSEDYKPAGAIVGYGMAHLDTIFENDDPDLIVPEPGRISGEREPHLNVIDYVDTNTAPMFFYHCRYDEYVPVKNPLMMAAKMEELNLPFELHIYESGIHGLSVNNELAASEDKPVDSSVTQWVASATAWMRKVAGIEAWLLPAGQGGVD